MNKVIKLFFIFNDPTDKDNVNMKEAFKTCTESDLKPEWTSATFVSKLPTTSNTVFVVQEFSGPCFEYLFEKQCLVCGPTCIRSCVTKHIPIPENRSPVFSIPMYNLIITATGLSKPRREEIQKLVGYMGGIFVEYLSKAVTHLICDGGLSTKCEKAGEAKIPVMMSSWVDEVWELSSKGIHVDAGNASLLKHKLLPFKGMYITFSGLPRKDKTRFERIITENGGIYLPSLVQTQTSVLVLDNPSGEKYKHAQRWNIPCVKSAWIEECAEKSHHLPITPFSFSDRPRCSTPTSDLPSFMSTGEEISVVPGPDTTRGTFSDPHSTMGSFLVSKKASDNKGMIPPVAIFNHRKALEELNISGAACAGLFLDGCRVFLSGFSSTEKEKLKKVLNKGGATMFMNASEQVSHVVVGDTVMDDVKEIMNLQTRPHLVSLEWIMASIREKSPAPVHPYLCNQESNNVPPPSPLSNKGLELLKPTLISSYPEPSICPKTHSFSRKLFEAPQGERKDPLESQGSDISNVTGSETLPPSAIYRGLVFEVIELHEQLSAISEAIETAGGTVAGSGFQGVSDYAVVPLFGTKAKVSAAEVVTVLWIEDCREQCQVAKVEYYHQPIYIMDDVKPLFGSAVCISGFDGKESTFITSIAKQLGSKVQKSLSKKDLPSKGILKATHLICSEPSGSKYTAAIKWGVPIVRKSWLLQSATSGAVEPNGKHAFHREGLPLTLGANTPKSDETGDFVPSSSQKEMGSNKEEIKAVFATPRTFQSFANENSPRVTPVASSSGLVISKRKLSQEVPLKQMAETSSVAMSSKALNRSSRVSTPDSDCSFGGMSPKRKEKFKKFLDRLPARLTDWDTPPEKKRKKSTPMKELLSSILKELLKEDDNDEGRHLEAAHNPNLPYRLTSAETRGVLETAAESCISPGLDSSEDSFRTSQRKTTKQFKKTNLARRILDDEDEDGDQIEKEIQAITSKMFRSADTEDCSLWEKYKNLEEKGTGIPDEIIERVSNRLKLPEINYDSEDADNQLKLAATPRNCQRDEIVTWDLKSPECLKKLVDLKESDEKSTEDRAMTQIIHETEGEPEGPSQKSKERKVFILSNIMTTSREKYLCIITNLGGEVSNSSTFDESATHLVIERPARSEKLLCSIASGKWVLHVSYLDQCYEARYFLPEDDFEWGNPRSEVRIPALVAGSQEELLSKAAYRWRHRVAELGSRALPFKNIKAVLLTGPGKASQFRRLLRAGGATLLDENCILDATHIFVDEGRAQIPVDVKSLLKKKIHCVPPVYLNELLVRSVTPNPKDYWIGDYKKAAEKI